MLQVVIPEGESFNEQTGEFLHTKEQTLQLEHSLVSVSKWESKWRKPFLSKDEKTLAEGIDYIRCMTLTQNVNPLVYNHIPVDVFAKVNDYIEAPMTATWFNDKNQKQHNREIITAEIIYYWMIALNIPFECQKWHLNKLLALIRVCNIKNAPQKKMNQREIANRHKALNAARRNSLHSKG